MSLFKCSSLLGPWVMCQSFSLCKGMAAATKVFSNSYSHPKEAKDCFLCMCILEALSGTQAVTSSASGLSISLEPQVFKRAFYMRDQDTSSTKITEFSVMASQMVLWPSISSLSILIHIQPPDWFFYTILLYDFFIPKPPMTFPFHRTPAFCFWCLSLPGLYHLLQTYLVWLSHFSALTGFAQACFCSWFPFILFSAPGKPLVSVRVPAGDKTVALKSLSRWRGSTEMWSAFGGTQQGRSVTPPSAQQEERTGHLEEGLPDKSSSQKWRGWCSCCQAGIRGRTKPSLSSYLLLESIPLVEPTGSQRAREAVHGSQLSKTQSRAENGWVCVCVCVCVCE